MSRTDLEYLQHKVRVNPWGVCALAASEAIDGCPTFAPAYVGRKRWAQPNDRFRRIDRQIHTIFLNRSITKTLTVLQGRMK
jgi:hypothetical protein